MIEPVAIITNANPVILITVASGCPRVTPFIAILWPLDSEASYTTGALLDMGGRR